MLNDGSSLRVYYAGNAGAQSWWGIGSTIGVRWFGPLAGTNSPPAIPQQQGSTVLLKDRYKSSQ
jgi:hypothetical protein